MGLKFHAFVLVDSLGAHAETAGEAVGSCASGGFRTKERHSWRGFDVDYDWAGVCESV